MNDFFIFIAPPLVLIGSIALAFWAALKDGAVVESQEDF
ncbi:hypothetical protein ACFQ3N_19265 [Virgibacillus byunsanensis]|uniref:Uncharacterized protein n=1 Tax=Virgibacillus byunsanensis TaxID=570945 RepID=A0ABW3LQ32_9BACI